MERAGATVYRQGRWELIGHFASRGTLSAEGEISIASV